MDYTLRLFSKVVLEMSLSIRPQVLLSVALAVVALLACEIRAEGLPPEVIAALESNAKALSPSESAWKVSRHPLLPINDVATLIGLTPEFANDNLFRFDETAKSVIDGNRVLARFFFTNAKIDKAGKLFFFPQELAISFDGSHVYYSDVYDGSAGLTNSLLIYGRQHARENQRKLGLTEQNANKWRTNFWETAGFKVPTSEFDLGVTGITSMVLYVARQSNAKVQSTSETIDGTQFTVVRISAGGRNHIFHLDPHRRYAVTQQMLLDDKENVISSIKCSKFRKLEDGETFLPTSAVLEYFQFRNKPTTPHGAAIFEERYTLTSITLAQPALSIFELTADPGTLVGDDRPPGAKDKESGLVHYIMPASLEDLDAAIKHAVDGTPFTPAALRKDNAQRKWLVAINIAIVLFLLATIIYRRIRAS